MMCTREPSIVISAYYHLDRAFAAHDIRGVVSILGPASDRLPWPEVGDRKSLHLAFDDTPFSSGALTAPTRSHIENLIGFARDWNGNGSLLVHCRAGSSRSPAAAIIAVAAIGRADLVRRVATAKSYFKPHLGCLRLADTLLGLSPALVDFAQQPVGIRTDQWEPVAVPL
jgi:predicted protein tyrosine phosphatase